MQTLEAHPRDLSASRTQARSSIEHLPESLRDMRVVLDASGVQAVSTSFVDELVLQILVDREASVFVVQGASERFRSFLDRSARLRDVSDRVIIET